MNVTLGKKKSKIILVLDPDYDYYDLRNSLWALDGVSGVDYDEVDGIVLVEPEDIDDIETLSVEIAGILADYYEASVDIEDL